MTTIDSHSNYIHKHLIAEIIQNLKEEETLERYDVQHSGGLDGFMSLLYTLTLSTRTVQTCKSKEHHMIVKFMKGDSNFRKCSKSYIQFANEIFIYAQVLPLYREMLRQAALTDIEVDNWVAPCYVAKFGYIHGLSLSPTESDAVLVLTNLKAEGYLLGPRLYLGREHLLKMAQTVGQYHSMSYALRVRSDPRLEQLKAGIVALPFCNEADPNDDRTNLYQVIYRPAFDRFFQYFDRVVADGSTFDLKSSQDAQLLSNLRRLRDKYFRQPTRLLEHLRTSIELTKEDRCFATILHGDYNRNNVLFRYKHSHQPEYVKNVGDIGDEVEDMKMIDFQELRWGSPAIDLSFFMYMNCNKNIRDEVWSEVLQCYHSNMFQTLSKVLKSMSGGTPSLETIEKQLQLYDYDRFYAHFSKFAFYGVVVCMHFLPWMLSSEEECGRLSHLFETDMHGEAFYQLSIDAGGDSVNREILEIIRHASRLGYMDNI